MTTQNGTTSSGEEWGGSAHLIEDTSRPWKGYWSWRDKPVGERGAVADVLAGAGLEAVGLRSLPEGQPPNCEAAINGKFCGIEVTELVHQPMPQRSLKGDGQPFVRSQERLRTEIQKRIY